jgi:hypothetical protein
VHPSGGAHFERHLVVVAANLAHGHKQSHLATPMGGTPVHCPTLRRKNAGNQAPPFGSARGSAPKWLTVITQPAAD